MIKKVKYNEIDFEKYTKCLENSVQRKYSATKLFLDVSSDHQWELLVYNDYEAVMPIPYILKWGFKIVVNPKLCQQLGIFSPSEKVEINDLFLDYFKRNYRIWYYAFNDSNKFTNPLTERKNYIIESDSFENIYKKYSPKRKRKLRLDEDILYRSEIKEINFSEGEDFFRHCFVGANNEVEKESFLDIFRRFEKTNSIKIYAFILDCTIINAVIIYVDDKTAALLGTFNNRDFVKISGSSVLINHAISQFITDRTFDFEGSEIPAIEEFFRGFRPELKPYQVIRYSKKDLLKNFFKI